MSHISPTGGTIRNDSQGHGYFQASRGSRFHTGVDWTLPGGPSQIVVAPVSCAFSRSASPYGASVPLDGAIFYTPELIIKMFYFKPYKFKKGERIKQGQPIGTAQSFAVKDPIVQDHIHEEIWINPLSL